LDTQWTDSREKRAARALSSDDERQATLPIGPHAEGPLRVGDTVRVQDPDGLCPVATGTILLIHADAQDVWEETLLSIVLDDGSEIEAAPGDVQLIIRVPDRGTHG